MTKADLIDFRARLVRAKRIHKRFRGSLEQVRGYVGLGMQMMHTHIWYGSATEVQRIAMWDNSIAHVDELIKGMK